MPGRFDNERLDEYQLGSDKKSKGGGPDGMADILTPNLRKIKVKAVYDVVFEIK